MLVWFLGGAVANVAAQTGPLTLTFQFSSTLAAHAQRAPSPAGIRERTRKSRRGLDVRLD